MISYSIIQKSQLEGAHRLDAEYYQPEYLELKSKLQIQNSKSLGEIGKVAYGTTPHGGIFEKSGMPFVRSQNFSNLVVDTSDLVFCTKEFHQQNKKSAIHPGDILFAAVGATIGEVAIVQDEIKEGNINQNIARVKITDEGVNSYFVGIFFASRPGQLQIERLITGNAQPYLNSEQIKAFVVPDLKDGQQREVANYFQEMQNQIRASQDFYSQAEDLLLEDLGLKNFEVEDDLSYIVNLSEVKSAHRADAEYFQPKYDELTQAVVRKFDVQELKEIFSFKRGVFISTKYYTEEKTGRPYIRIKELSGDKSGIDESKVIYIDERYSENKPNVLKENDLVVAIIGDTIGKVNRINRALAGGFCSNNMGRLRIKSEWGSKIIPEFSEVLFQSIFVQWQIERKKAQTGQPKIGDNEVKSVIVPILPKPTQQKIADLVQKSHEARSKAKQLLAQAKSKVENLIET